MASVGSLFANGVTELRATEWTPVYEGFCARNCIRHGQHHISARLNLGVLACITGIQLYIGGFDGERAPTPHRITGIDGQIHQYLFYLRGVCLDMSQVREQ